MYENIQVEYVPPPNEVIDEYAKQVCACMQISDDEIQYGFANFLKVCTKIVANQMNNEQHVEMIKG